MNSLTVLKRVPAGEVWVYRGFGYRASIAAAVLDRDNHSVVLINDFYPSAGMGRSRPAHMTDK
jgi:hypothetical protein